MLLVVEVFPVGASLCKALYEQLRGCLCKERDSALNSLQFCCVLVLLKLQMALQNEFHVLHFSNSLCLQNSHAVVRADEKGTSATCQLKRQRVKIPDKQRLPQKNTIPEAAPHAMPPVKMGSWKPQSELLFCTERCDYYICNRACGQRRGILEVF